MSKVLAVNEFAKRHTASSPFSHFEGPWEELIALVEDNMEEAKPGFRLGVLVVPVPPEKFRTPVVIVEPETRAETSYSPRVKGEKPRWTVPKVPGEKGHPSHAAVVIYAHDVLQEDGDASTTAEWEIVTLVAGYAENEPPHPTVVIANHFGWDGATKDNLSDAEFVELLRIASDYWRNKAFVDPSL